MKKKFWLAVYAALYYPTFAMIWACVWAARKYGIEIEWSYKLRRIPREEPVR